MHYSSCYCSNTGEAVGKVGSKAGGCRDDDGFAVAEVDLEQQTDDDNLDGPNKFDGSSMD